MAVLTTLLKAGSSTISITSSGSTDAVNIPDHIKGWSVILDFTAADADPLINFEGSNDSTNWTNMFSEVTDAALGTVTPIEILMTKAFSDTSDGINAASNSQGLPFAFFRVTIDPNGATAGTMTGVLNLTT